MHDGHRERLRERALQHGIEHLETHELLELILYAYIPRKDTNCIAHELLNIFGSLSQVLDADIEDLANINNMTRNAAIYLHSIPFISNRYIKDKNMPKKNLSTILNAVEYLKAETKFLIKEKMFVLCLDTHFNLIKSVQMCSNSIDRVNISIKDIHTAVLRHNTKNVILGHNHPGGSMLPSDDDVTLTIDIINSMSYIDVEVLDHIIVTDNNYFSFREKGLLQEITKHSNNNIRYAAEKVIGVERNDD